MTLYEIIYPDEDNNTITEILTKEEILSSYWDYWTSRMSSVGREHLISEERCIEDWCVIHWASKIQIPI